MTKKSNIQTIKAIQCLHSFRFCSVGFVSYFLVEIHALGNLDATTQRTCDLNATLFINFFNFPP